MLPHDQVIHEIKQAPIIAEKKYLDSFDSILDGTKNDYTFFRFSDLPEEEEVQRGRKEVEKLVQEFGACSF